MREVMNGSTKHEILDVQGIKTSFIKEGDPNKKLLLFLHGWGGTKETWESFLEPIGEGRFFSIAIDLPGFGESDRPKSWGVEDYSKFLEKFIGKIGKSKVSLIGRSFGGRIIANLAAERSDLVDKLVLVSAAGIPDQRLKTRLKTNIAKMGKKAFSLPGLSNFSEEARNFLYKIYGVTNYTNADADKRDIFVRSAGFRVESILSKIKSPTLLIWGENDKETPLDNAYIMNSLISNSKLIVFPEASHQVQADQKSKFISEVTSFLLSS